MQGSLAFQTKINNELTKQNHCLKVGLEMQKLRRIETLGDFIK